MPSPLVQYAPTRGISYLSLTQDPANVAAFVDAFKAALLTVNWTCPNTCAIQASGGMSIGYAAFTPVTGSGGDDFGITWLGSSYIWYDPSIGQGPPVGAFGVLVGSTVAASLTNLVNSLNAHGTDGGKWVWSFVAPFTVQVTATCLSLLGTAGNGFSATGRFGDSMTTTGGGWALFSQLANGVTQIEIDAVADGDAVLLHINLNGNVITKQPDAFVSYTMVANPYQVALFEEGQTAGPTMFVCAPYIYPDYLSSLGYAAYAKISEPVNIFGEGPAQIDGGVAAICVNGSFFTGAEQEVLFYTAGGPLFTSANKTLFDQVRLALRMSALGESRVVGSIWDALAETQGYALDNWMNYDGHNWTTLYSQAATSLRTAGTVWLAVN